MTKPNVNQKGFTAVEGLLIILILVVIGGVGYMVYHNDHETKVASVASTVATKPSTPTKKTTPPTVNPYAGWSSATLTNEKLSFSYPSTWKFTDFDAQQTTNDGSDSVEVTSPSGVEVNISTDNVEHPSLDFPTTLEHAEPTTFLGQTAYIDYYSGSASASDPILDGSVAYSSTDFPVSHSGNPFSSPDYLKTKNMSPQGWLLIDVHTPIGSSTFEATVVTNQDYADAKLIVQSMHY